VIVAEVVSVGFGGYSPRILNSVISILSSSVRKIIIFSAIETSRNTSGKRQLAKSSVYRRSHWETDWRRMSLQRTFFANP
jgi:hypothetical protein